jgi:flagellar assembly protein FliH
MGLIKASVAPPSMAPFSMRDVEAQAQAIVLRAKEQADKLLATAAVQAADIRKQAQTRGMEDGRKAGVAQGLKDGGKTGHDQALNENRAALAALIKSLTASVQELENSRRDLEVAGLREVVDLATAIARRITKRQGALDPAVLSENLKEAMKLAVHAADVRIAVHPSQMKILEAELPNLKMTWPQLQHVALAEDAGLALGGCRIFTTHGQVDGSLEAQLDRVVNDISPAPLATSAAGAETR